MQKAAAEECTNIDKKEREMTKLVIVGGGGHAKVVLSLLGKLSDFDVVGYVDPNDMGTVLGADYLGDDDVLPTLMKEQGVKAAALGIGHPRSGDVRRSAVEKLKILGYSLPPVISPDAVVNVDVALGDGAVVMDRAVINCGSVVGEYSIVNTGAIVEHDCGIGAFAHIAPGATVCGGVTVGDDSLVGAGAVIIPGCEVTAGCIMGAGAVVTGDCAESGVYAGIPARRLR